MAFGEACPFTHMESRQRLEASFLEEWRTRDRGDHHGYRLISRLSWSRHR